jgi:hypothetical protein
VPGGIIFNLPNGLQGYLLVNGKDERIDASRIEVVSDGLKTSGTAAIVNGLLCIACHGKEMKSDFKDMARNGSCRPGAAFLIFSVYGLPAREQTAASSVLISAAPKEPRGR